MAGKVKKGFGTYMFILLLTLIAAFLVVVLVMVFSPFQNILGYQYVFYQDVHTEYNVTGGGTDTIFDLSAMEEIKINCSYADVQVCRTNDVDKNAIRIENKVTGFSHAEDFVDFSYEIYYQQGSDDKILCVDVNEAECFLYFSQHMTVSILLPIEDEETLDSVKLNVTNSSGDIIVGLGGAVDVLSLDLKTQSGEIILCGTLDPMMAQVFINSKSGNVQAVCDIRAYYSFALHSESGRLSFQNIVVKGLLPYDVTATMNLGNSEFAASSIIGNIDLEIEDGYFDVTSLEGDINGNNAAEPMTTPAITIEKVQGNVSFPFANASRIKIGEMTGVLYVNGTTGFVNVGTLNGYGWVEMTSGNVDIGLNGKCEIKTTSGAINVVYNLNEIADKLAFESEGGTIKVGVNALLPFTLNVTATDGQARTSNNVEVEGFGSNFTLPLSVNGGTKLIDIKTDGKVEVYINK